MDEKEDTEKKLVNDGNKSVFDICKYLLRRISSAGGLRKEAFTCWL